jgi:two-component system nitrate/nitrite response regulator NarL
MHELTDREIQISKLIFSGKSNKKIALELGIVEKTVKIHIDHIYSKLNIHSIRELPKKLYQLEYISINDFGDDV